MSQEDFEAGVAFGRRVRRWMVEVIAAAVLACALAGLDVVAIFLLQRVLQPLVLQRLLP